MAQVKVENCHRCRIPLNNVTTGIVIVRLVGSPPNVAMCRVCADFVVKYRNAVEMMQAKSIRLDE